MSPHLEKLLCTLLFLLVVFVLGLGYYDPTSRPAVIDFAKVALGGILTAISATVATRLK
jgi:hypothetical protein